MALGTVTPPAPLSADDTWRLCDVGYVSVDCEPQSARKPESYLVHGVVQLAHAGIMAAQALANPEQIGHLWGDVPALLVVAAVLAFLTPRGTIATALAVGKKINS